MPIENSSDDTVTVKISEPSGVTAPGPIAIYSIGGVTGLGTGLLLCGLAAGNPAAAIAGGLTLAVGAASTFALRRRFSVRRSTELAALTPTAASIQELGELDSGEQLAQPSNFNFGVDVEFTHGSGGIEVARFRYDNQVPCVITDYLDSIPGGNSGTTTPLNSFNDIRLKLVGTQQAGYTIDVSSPP